MKRIHLMLAVVIVTWIGASANAQSVADLARQERERKKSVQSKTVLTNGSRNVPQNAEPGNLTVTNPPPTTVIQKEPIKPPVAAAAAATVPTDNKGRDEKYWRTTFEKARQDLKRAEDKLRLIDLKLNDLQGTLYRESIYAREMEIREQLTLTEKDQAAAREEFEASQKKIADLEEELRRSGGPPGWAR